LKFLEVFQILISPIKAFKKIVKEPSYIGPLTVLVLTLIATVGVQYTMATRINIEIFALDNTLIPSNGPPYSITSGFVDFNGATKISVFTYDWTSGSDNVTVYGLNATEQNDFQVVQILENNTAYYTTKNFTSITKVEFSKAGDGAMQYIALGTNQYETVLESGEFSGWLVSSLINEGFRFCLNWALFAMLLYLVIKVFREKPGSLGSLIMIVGNAFIVALFRPIVSALLIPLLPQVILPLPAWHLPQGATEASRIAAIDLYNQIYQQTWYSNVTYQVLTGLSYALDIWVVALFAVAVHFHSDISWKKAGVISVIAFVARILLSFIGF
jgi:hypothetical protein